MKKTRFMTLLLTLMAVLLLLSTSVFAADANSDGYDDGDVAAIQKIIEGSSTLPEILKKDDPTSWDSYVTWTDTRVTSLDISSWGFTGTLDVSDLTALTELDCYENPKLTALDVSSLPELQHLDCDYTNITKLNVSNNPKLETLWCSGTGITELDVSNNTVLTELSCYNTGITALDVSNNTALTYLDCDNTNITKLDVSGNTKLETLWCSGTGITELDVSNNTALTNLYCYDTPIAKFVTRTGSLTIQQVEGASVIIDAYDASTGKVTLWANLDYEYEFNNWTGLPDSAEVDDNDDNYVTFPLNANLAVSISVTKIPHDEVCPSADFPDLNTSKWYHEATDFVIRVGLMQGYTDGTFKPDATLSRAMLVRILYNLEWQPEVTGTDSFTDTDTGRWYSDAILWAEQEGIVEGYPDGTFRPNAPLSRQEMVTILYRYAEWCNYDLPQGSYSSFPDANKVQKFAQEAMNWAVGQGLIIGMKDGTLCPRNNSTRAQVAQVMVRFMTTILDYSD